MPYLYDDEDNAPMNDDAMKEDPYLKYTTYSCKAEEEADLRGEIPFSEPPENGCWNCFNFNGDYCTKYWNNNDESYKDPDRDSRDYRDWCSDWEHDESIKPEEFFEGYGGNDP